MPDEEPGEIITIAEVKTLLQITDDSKDDLIIMLIPIVENEVIEYLNNDFGGEYPEALKGYIARMIYIRMEKPKDGISTESISRYSISYNIDIYGSGGYPASIARGLSKWRKVKW